MTFRGLAITFLAVFIARPVSAQLSQDARFEILRTVIAQQAAARIALPRSSDGVELTDAGAVNPDKVTRQIDKDGLAIAPGKVVTITQIGFGDKSIEVEIDGGTKKKKGILDRIEVGMGNSTRPIGGDQKEDAKGARLVLKFDGKVPSNLTPDQLRAMLNPLLDFDKSNFLNAGVDALPPEFREAVQLKEARIGMDKSTVLLALGRPNHRFTEKVNGTEQEDWLYNGKGFRATFVTFEDNVVIRIREHGPTP